jgi:hypothetical protein
MSPVVIFTLYEAPEEATLSYLYQHGVGWKAWCQEGLFETV